MDNKKENIMPYYESLDLLLLHIPKTGGSWITRMLFRVAQAGKPILQTPWSEFLTKGQFFLRPRCYSQQHYTASDIVSYFHHHDMSIKNVKEVWFLTRHPTSRLLSEYFYLKYHVIPSIRKTNAVNELPETWTPYGPLFHSISFDTFRDFCFTAFLACAHTPLLGDGHFRPQVEFLQRDLASKNHPLVDIQTAFPHSVVRHFRFENFDEVYKHVGIVVTERELPWTATHQQTPVTKLKDEIKQSEIVSLDLETLALIHHWYRQDFFFFGYDPFLTTFDGFKTQMACGRSDTHSLPPPSS